MLVVRKEGKAHEQYNSFRSAFELLEAVGREPHDGFNELQEGVSTVQKQIDSLMQNQQQMRQQIVSMQQQNQQQMVKMRQQTVSMQQQNQQMVKMQQRIDKLEGGNEKLWAIIKSE